MEFHPLKLTVKSMLIATNINGQTLKKKCPTCFVDPLWAGASWRDSL